MIDYAYFIAALSAFLLMGVAALHYITSTEKNTWQWLTVFGFLFFLYHILNILDILAEKTHLIRIHEIVILYLAAFCLIEFSRRILKIMEKPVSGYYLYFSILFLLLLTAIYDLSNFIYYSLILIGTISFTFTALMLWNIKSKAKKYTIYYKLFSALLFVFGILHIITLLNVQSFFGVSQVYIFNAYGLVLFLIAISTWNATSFLDPKQTEKQLRKRKIILTVSASILLIFVIITGWIFADFYGKQAIDRISEKNLASSNILVNKIENEYRSMNNAVTGISGSHWIGTALLYPKKSTLNAAKKVLQRYQKAFEVEEIFVLDIEGHVLVSSEADENKIDKTKNHLIYPYFKNSRLGKTARYLMVEENTRNHVFYTSTPVWDKKQNIIGILVIKKEIKNLLTYRTDPDVTLFYCSPDGVVFAANQNKYISHFMWPVPQEVKNKITTENQFGKIFSDPLIKSPIQDGKTIYFNNQRFQINIVQTKINGWFIVSLGDVHQFVLYRFIAIILTFFVAFVIITMFLSYARNIDKNQFLRISELRTRTIIDSAPEAIIVVNPKTFNIIEANQFSEYITGYSKKALEKINLNKLIWDGFDELKTDIMQIDDKSLLELNGTALVRKDGTVINISGVCTRINWGEIIAYIFFLNDVTESLKAQKLIEEKEHKYRNLFDNASDAIILMYQNKIHDCNTKAAEIFGTEIDQLKGKTPIRFLPEEQPDGMLTTDLFQQHFKETEEQGLTRFTCQYLQADGTPFYAGVSLNRVEVENKMMIQAIIRDISDQKNLEKTLEDARDKAIEASKTKSEFLANMSHEIRTPMNGVIGMLDLLRETSLDEEQVDFVNTAKVSAESLLTIINDILDFSKIEAGKLDVEYAEVDIHTLIEKVSDTLVKLARDKGLELIYSVDANVPRIVKSDPVRLRQVLINLGNNAIKFTKEGEIVISCSLEKEVDDQVFLKFNVKDTGIGIPPEKQKYVFGAFQQADGSTTRMFGGTGLGLSISNHLVRLMKGKIKLKSKVDEGSEFYFVLPFPKDEIVYERRTLISEDIQGKKVLIVDDNATNRKILLRMVENFGMVGETVSNGVDGLSYLKENQDTSLVLLDVQMPGMSGHDFIEELVKQYPQRTFKTLVLSSSGSPKESNWFKENGCNGFLMKPVKQLRLRELILKAFEIEKTSEKKKRRAEDKKEEKQNFKNIKVLLAEDNVINQKVAVRFLEKEGMQVVVANNGKEAVEMIEIENPDIVFMDIQMPEMDGLEATKVIRKLDSEIANVPILAMTAHAMKGDRDMCIAAGMNDYVSKPFQKNELFEKIRIHTS